MTKIGQKDGAGLTLNQISDMSLVSLASSRWFVLLCLWWLFSAYPSDLSSNHSTGQGQANLRKLLQITGFLNIPIPIIILAGKVDSLIIGIY